MQGEVETRRIRSHCSFPARVFVSALIVAFCACLLAPDLSARALADETATQFRQWLAQTVWPDAQKRGVSRETFDKAFADMRLALDLPDLQRPGSTTSRDEQAQLEFQDPRRYFVEGQLSSLSKAGVGLLARWGSALSAIEQLYGVPKEIIVAIWGRESHFGRVAPKRQALRVLATQAFMGRRRALYYPELLAALVILEEDHVPAEMLLSSWAGAMGQPQLLPSKFLRYAVDGDGDGKRDIWRSAPDSLASIANYLREHGWVRERGWGFETRVPGDVSCTFEGPRRGKPMREWARLGLTRVDGTALPSTNASALTYLLMPVGRLGPAFLVSENFYVLKEYNEFRSLRPLRRPPRRPHAQRPSDFRRLVADRQDETRRHSDDAAAPRGGGSRRGRGRWAHRLCDPHRRGRVANETRSRSDLLSRCRAAAGDPLSEQPGHPAPPPRDPSRRVRRNSSGTDREATQHHRTVSDGAPTESLANGVHGPVRHTSRMPFLEPGRRSSLREPERKLELQVLAMLFRFDTEIARSEMRLLLRDESPGRHGPVLRPPRLGFPSRK